MVLGAGQASEIVPLPAAKTTVLATNADSVLVKTGDRRASFHIQPSFDVGTISPYKQFLWFVTRHWLLLVPTLFVAALLFAWLLKNRLANAEYRRLIGRGDI